MSRFACVLIAAVLMSTSCGVFAGSYSDTVTKQSRCEAAGNLAKSAYGISAEQLKSQMDAVSKDAKEKKISKKTSGDFLYILFMGNSAKSPQDAYMRAWAWCMDQN